MGLGRFGEKSPGWARVWQEGAVLVLFLNPNSNSNHLFKLILILILHIKRSCLSTACLRHDHITIIVCV
jgi:hypothetical protein